MVILITGVSSGFGRAIAAKLADEGHQVYGTVRRVVEPIDGVNYLTADVSDMASVMSAFDALMAEQGRIDVFINNAGMGIGGPLEFTPIDDVARQMDVNFMGMVRFLSLVVPVMRRQGYGKILCISSIGGLLGLPYQGAYSASKYAVEGYCEALRLELHHTGVKVVLIQPGDFSTGFTSNRKKVASEEAFKSYPSYERSISGIEQDEKSGLSSDYFASKISKIIRKKNPAYSYIVSTFLQRLAVVAKWLLPAPVFAWVLRLYYKL